MGGTTPRIGQAPVLGLPDRRRSFRWTLLCRSKLGLAFQEPVTGPVEPDPDPLARGGRDRGGAAQHGERGVAWAATRMGPGTQHHRGHDRPTPSRREQLRVPGPHQGGDGSGVLGDLGVQELDAATQGAQAGCGGGGLRIPVDPQPEPPAGADQARRGQITQPTAEGYRERRPPARAAGVGRRRSPGRRSGERPAAPRARPDSRRPLAGRAGHGPAPRGPP
jgi:hypothetical protein